MVKWLDGLMDQGFWFFTEYFFSIIIQPLNIQPFNHPVIKPFKH